MNKNLLYILLGTIILIVASFYFLQSDEKYIKKTTVKLLNLVVPSSPSLSTTAILKKVNTMSEYVHFSVQYEININGHVHQDSSLADLRSSMMVYFRKFGNNKWQVDVPAKQEINVKIHSSEGRKTAEVSFNIKVAKEGKKASCETTLNWIKEKQWLIHKIRVFNCNLTH